MDIMLQRLMMVFMNHSRKILGIYFAVLSMSAFADISTMYFNGDILTMEGDKPSYIEAVVVMDKKIAYAGNMKDALNKSGTKPICRQLMVDGRIS